MKNEKLKGSLMLILTALIWGSAFVAQRVGIGYVGPFTFNAVRFFIGALVLLPFIWAGSRKRRLAVAAPDKGQRRTLLLGGLCCGTALFIASSLQQLGIVGTDAGKSGFITSLYIVFVPLMGVLLGKKPPARIWVAVAAAVVGLYLLCGGSLSLNKYDAMTLLCAVVFALHIIIVSRFSPRTDCLKLSSIQFFVCGVLSAVMMLVLEKPSVAALLSAWLPIIYAGALSCGVAYTLQVVAQKYTDPAVASILMSLESVFAVLSGWALLGERLSAPEICGCALMFAAALLSELQPGKRRAAAPAPPAK